MSTSRLIAAGIAATLEDIAARGAADALKNPKSTPGYYAAGEAILQTPFSGTELAAALQERYALSKVQDLLRRLDASIFLYYGESYEYSLLEDLVTLTPAALAEDLPELLLTVETTDIGETDDPESFRRTTRHAIYSVLSGCETHEDAVATATSIEAACWVKYGNWDRHAYDVREVYLSRMGTITENLDPESLVCKRHGAWLYEQLRSGALTPTTIVKMTAVELNPPAAAAVCQEVDQRRSIKIEGQVSHMYKCPNCYARSATIEEKQLRSGDEGKNVFATCTECDTRWKAA
jgi:DNA-directed RNA polymerase subunit M/transcription elongation factor TFIIS